MLSFALADGIPWGLDEEALTYTSAVRTALLQLLSVELFLVLLALTLLSIAMAFGVAFYFGHESVAVSTREGEGASFISSCVIQWWHILRGFAINTIFAHCPLVIKDQGRASTEMTGRNRVTYAFSL